MSVCISAECKKFKKCARSAWNTEGVHTARYYAEATSAISNEKGTTVKYLCGELGNYANFKPTKSQK